MTIQLDAERKNTKLSLKETLRDNLIRINDNQLLIIAQISILEIYQKSTKLDENIRNNISLIKSLGKEEKLIMNLYNEVKNKISCIELILESKDISDNLGVEYFKDLRNEITELLHGISGYLTEIAYVNEISKDILDRSKINKTNDIRIIELNSFYQQIYNYLTKDMDTLNDKIIEIVKCIPLSISKLKYYDIIKESMLRSFTNKSKIQTNIILGRYKGVFNSALEFGYGQRFDKYFIKAQELRKFDFKKATLKQIEEMYFYSSDVMVEMYRIIDIIKECGLIVNRFIILNMLKNNLERVDINSFMGKLASLKINDNSDCQDGIINYLKNEIYVKEQEFHKCNLEFNKHSNKYLEKSLSNIDKEIHCRAIKTQNVLAYFNDYFLEKEELLLYNEEKKIDMVYLEQAIGNFIQFIDRNIKDMPNLQRKVRMRRILTLLDTPFKTPDDFFFYLRNSVEFIRTNEEKKVILNKILRVIENFR